MRRTRPELTPGSILLVAALATTACAVGTTADTGPGDPSNAPPLDPPASTAKPVVPSTDASVTDAGKGADTSVPDTGAPDTSTGACAGYAAPTVAAGCMCAAGKTCTANNCYGGYYCELTAIPPKCVPKPATCP